MRTLGNGKIRRTGEGVSYGSGATIKQLCDWDLATDDDIAAIETSGFFDPLASEMNVGELIDCRLDLNGSPVHRRYMVSSIIAGVVTVVRSDDLTATLGARAVVPTVAGLTTGLLLPTDRMVEVTSGNADHQVTLPPASAATRGRQILIYVAPSTNCELRTPTGSSTTINNVDCSGGAVEALMAHSHTYRLTQHLANGWLMEKLTNLGAVATAVVPD